jgi:hypothetical protein
MRVLFYYINPLSIFLFNSRKKPKCIEMHLIKVLFLKINKKPNREEILITQQYMYVKTNSHNFVSKNVIFAIIHMF